MTTVIDQGINENTESSSNVDLMQNNHNFIDQNATVESHLNRTLPENVHTNQEHTKNTTTQIASSLPPPLPHVNVNQLPLSVLIRNLCIFALGEIKQFFKLSKPNRRFEFLKLIIYLRNQFLRLYVLVKWCKTTKNNNFHLLIDMLNYLRQQNMNIGHCIWHLKNSVISGTINAKLPNPDLETALEVFNLGRPNLNNDIIVNNNNSSTGTSIINKNNNLIPIDLIKKKLRDLNVLLSIRVAMMDLPRKYNFGNHYIQDGRLIICVAGEYEIQLSTATPQSPFYFVDFKLSLLDAQASNKPLYLKKYINELLLRERDNTKVLYLLEKFLSKYILSLKIYLCNKRLSKLSKEKYSNNLICHYDQKKSLINIRYWVFSRVAAPSDCKIVIGMSKDEETGDLGLVLKWGIKSSKTLQFGIPTVYKEDILHNLFDVLDEIIFNHIQIIKHQLLSADSGIFYKAENVSVDNTEMNNHMSRRNSMVDYSSFEMLQKSDTTDKKYDGNKDITVTMKNTEPASSVTADNTSLTIYLPTTCTTTTPVRLKINPITGLLYFSNSNSQLLLTYMDRLNKNFMKPSDIVNSLYHLKLAKTVQILSNMFSKCGWSVCSDSVMKLPRENLHPHHDELLKKKTDILSKDIFIRLNNWPANWYLVLNVLSSPTSCFVESKIAKIISQQGVWCLKYLSDNVKGADDNDTVDSSKMMKLEHVSYQRIDYFSNTILSKIINHIILDSLNELGIEKNIVTESIKLKLPEYITKSLLPNSNTTIIAINIDSLMKTSVSILDSTVFLSITFGKEPSHNRMSLFGKFTSLIDTRLLRSSDCKSLLIDFIDEKCFVMETANDSNTRIIDHLNSLGNQLTGFKKKLTHLIVLSDVIARLTKSFQSPNFKIVSLKPNEVCFNYLPKPSDWNNDISDCTIKLKNQYFGNNQESQDDNKLEFKLDPSNPQMNLAPFLEDSNYDHEFLFKYFQFTSNMFTVIEDFKKNDTQPVSMHFKIHSLSNYELSYIYYNQSTIQVEQINLLIDIKSKTSKRKEELLYFIHFSNLSNQESSKLQEIVGKTQKIFFNMKKVSSSNNDELKVFQNCKSVVKLNSGVCCSDNDIKDVLTELHGFLISQ